MEGPQFLLTDQQLGNALDEIEDAFKAGDLDLDRILEKLQQLLDCLVQEQLTPEQASHVMRISLGKFVQYLLKIRLNEPSTERVNNWFYSVMHATIELLRTQDAWEMVDCTSRILTDSPNYNFYQLGVCAAQLPSCDVDSQSSGSGSDYDDPKVSPKISHGPRAAAWGTIISSVSHDEVPPCLLRNVECFHQMGGFAAILDRLDSTPRVGLSAMRALLRPILKVRECLKRAVLQSFARRVEQAIAEYPSSLTDEQLKQEDRKTMTDVYRQLDQLLHSAKLPSAAESMDRFRLALALKCLRTPFLEKRLVGITDIKEIISASLRRQEHMESADRDYAGSTSNMQVPLCWCSPDVLLEWLEREQVVSLVFGEGLHDQVARRSVEVLCFMAMRAALDPQMLTMIWRASLDKHETVRQCIYSLLVDVSTHLQLPLLHLLYAHIQKIPLAEYTPTTMTLLRGFAISAISSPHNQQKPPGKFWFGMEELWQIMQDGSAVSADMRMMAGTVMQDLLGWQHCYPQRGEFLIRCVEQLRAGVSVPQSLRLCTKTISSFPGKQRKKEQSATAVLEWLAGTHNLLPSFFVDFRRYHQAASERLQPLQDAWRAAIDAGHSEREQLASAELRAQVTRHMTQLQERLDFLHFCMTEAPLTLSLAQLDVLWECCVVSPCCPAEEDQLFSWLEQVRMNSSQCWDIEATRHLFDRFAATELESLTAVGYACGEYLFRWINWKEQRFVQQDTSNFMVLELPLSGVDTLWQVALRTRDADVGQRAAGFLTQLYHSLKPEHGAEEQQARRREFVRSCMTPLAAASERLRFLGPLDAPGGAPDAAAVDEDDERPKLRLCIERCLTLLRLFVEEVEAKLSGVAEPARRHGTVVRGTPMRMVITLVGGGNSPKVEVVIDSNQTVAALRQRIWEQLASHGSWQPEQPRMLRMITAGRELKEDRCMLADLKLREPYIIHAMRRQQTKPAADDDGAATVAAPRAAVADMEVDGNASGGGGGSRASEPAGSGAQRAEDAGSLPGQLLSEEGSHFGTLFELLTLRDERLSERTWQLLMMLPTNRAMESGLQQLSLVGPQQRPDWPALLHPGPSSFKLLYSLQIVDFLMLQGDNESAARNAPGGGGGGGGSSVGSSPWCAAFLAHGGLEHLLSMLRAPAAGSPDEDLLDPKRGSQRKLCLVLLLRVLCQFLLREPPVGAATLSCDALKPLDLAASDLAGPQCLPCWAEQRSFSLLVPEASADEARGADFSTRLLALVARVAGKARPANYDLHDHAPADGSEEALDVQIVREVLQLLVACARAERGSLAVLFRRSAPLHAYLLSCDSTFVRLEIAAALHSLCSLEPELALPPSSGDAAAASGPTVRAASLAALRELLPQVEGNGERCRQYFELYQALLVQGCVRDERDERASASVAPGLLPVQELCCQLTALIRQHEIRERRDRPELVDQALLGYITLLLALVRARPALKPFLGRADGAGLVGALFDDLFYLPSLADARRLGPAAPPKCKSADCRAAALGLLLELADDESHNLAAVTSLMLDHQLQRGGAPRAQWHFMPAAQEKARVGYVGLKNLGATCYLNSLLQQLYMIPAFRNAVLSLPTPAPPAAGTPTAQLAGDEAARSLLYQLQHMFGYLQESEKKWFDTRELCAAFRDADNAPVNPSVQMDVDEFFMQLFEQLETALKGTDEADLLKSLFQGEMVNQVLAKDSKHTYSERLETWFTISLDCKSKRSVLDSLADFFEGEVLDGDNKYKCDDGEYVEAVKRCCVHSLPPVLILHLKRFEFDFDLMRKFKINDHCDFPALIDMKPYTAGFVEQQEREAAPAGEGRATAAPAPAPAAAPAGEGDAADGTSEAAMAAAAAAAAAAARAAATMAAGCDYALVGVLVHSGTSDSGHYYSFIKERQARSAEGRGSGDWMHFNDTLVEPFDPRDIPKCCYGGVEPVTAWDAELHKQVQRTQPKPHSAYMLFYERVVQPTQPAHDASPTGAPTGAPTGRGGGASPSPSPPLREASSGSLVPAHIVRSVWAENMQFLRDRYVFDAIHFHAVRRLVGLALRNQPADGPQPSAAVPSQSQQQLSLPAMQLGCRFYVETLAHAKDKSTLSDWVALLSGGLQASLPACRWLLLQAEQDDWLRQMLLHCTVADVRTGFADLLLLAMRCLRPSEVHCFAAAQAQEQVATLAGVQVSVGVEAGEPMDDEDVTMGGDLDPAGGSSPLPPKAASLRVVRALVNLLHEAPSHWRHFPQFFLVLLEFAQLGTEERTWLLHQRVITQLVDFYLGDESPLAAGDAPYHQPKRTRMGDKFSLPNLEHMLALISLLARSAKRSLAQLERTPFSLEGPLLDMDEQEHQLACHSSLLGKVLKEGLNVHALGELVQHYCFASQRTTSDVLQCVLHGVDTMDSESLGPYLQLFSTISLLADNLLAWRVAHAMPRLLRVIAANMRYKQATIACLRTITTLCAQPVPRTWMLTHQDDWLHQWLIDGHSDLVRIAAEELVYAVCAPAAAAAAARARADAAEGAEDAAAALPPLPPTTALLTSVVPTFDNLLQLLSIATEVARESGPETQMINGAKAALDDPPPPRLAPYFRVCAWCVRHGAAPCGSHTPDASSDALLNELALAYAVQDSHHWECDMTKLEMIRFWHELVVAPQPGGPHGPLAVASTPHLFRKLLDTFVSLRPNDLFLQFNREYLPPFYGLLRAVLARGGAACAQVLQTHRNWEWAIRYVLIESSDYAQLPAEAEPEGSLGQSLMYLLRSSCASADFRRRVLAATLQCKKLPHNTGNVLTLLELTIADDDGGAGLDAAIELDVLAQLCSCLDHPQGLAYIEGQRWRQLHGLLRLICRCVQRIRHQATDDEPRRQRVLLALESAGGGQALLNMVFVLLRASLGLRSETSRSGPNRSEAVLRALPPDRFRPLQLVCFELAIALAALSRQWAALIVGCLLVHHSSWGAELPSVDAPTPAATAAAARDADAEDLASHTERPATLAGLSMVEALREVAANAERLGRYYEFATELILGSLREHEEPGVVASCLRLALMLATETSVLPHAHGKLMHMLVSVARAQPSEVHARLLAEHEAAALLLRRLLIEQPALLLGGDDAHAYCLEMLRLAPPAEAQLCAMLDACAARIVARALGRAAAEDAELAGFQSAVRLLCDASALAAEHWRDQHGAAAEVLSPGVD